MVAEALYKLDNLLSTAERTVRLDGDGEAHQKR